MCRSENKACVATYIDNFDDEPLGNIREIIKKDIPDHDILVGGFLANHSLWQDIEKGLMMIVKYFLNCKTLEQSCLVILFLRNARHSGTQS